MFAKWWNCDSRAHETEVLSKNVEHCARGSYRRLAFTLQTFSQLPRACQSHLHPAHTFSGLRLQEKKVRSCSRLCHVSRLSIAYAGTAKSNEKHWLGLKSDYNTHWLDSIAARTVIKAMALPATSTSPPTPTYPHSQPNWRAEHSQPSHRNSPHGQKRRADEVDDLQDRSNNISTNFKRLRINHSILPTRQAATSPRPHDPLHPHPDSHASIASHPAYQPPSVQSLDPPSYQYQPPSQHNLHPHSHHASATIQTQPSGHLHPHHAYLSPNREYTHTPPPQPFLGPPSRTSTATSLSDEPMTLDHDPCPTHPPQEHKVLITDLSAELAEIEASELAKQADSQAHTFFLPDEYVKEISGVPAHVLRHQTSSSSNRNSNALLASSTMRDSNIPPLSIGPSHDPSSSQALILYKDPFSISVPDDEDAVRKAVSEARRMRNKHKLESEHPSPSQSNDTTMHIHPPDSDIEPDHQDAEPYMRQALNLPLPANRTPHPPTQDGSRRYNSTTNNNNRNSTPLPINFQLLHNINVRQPTMSAPYISLPLPIDIDDDDQHRHDNALHLQEPQQSQDKRRRSWDEDAMDIE